MSAAAYSLGHGGNDAQKTMGIIAGLLFTGGVSSARFFGNRHLWVILLAHAAIALGTLTGGWRIIHTMGSKINQSEPRLAGSPPRPRARSPCSRPTHLGVPVSTTHTITGAIIGVGSIRRCWRFAGRLRAASSGRGF